MEYFNVYNKKYVEIAKRNEIYPQFKIELLDHRDNVINDISQELSLDTGGSISINYQQGTRRSCSITFSDPTGKFLPDYNSGLFWINRKFKLYIGLKDIYTGDIYWFSQGVFLTLNPSAVNNFSDRSVTIQGVDKFGLFGSESGYNQLEGTYSIKAGTNAYSAISDTLMLEMGNGNVLDSIEPILDPKFKDEVLPYDINKAPGNYLSDILIEIADVLGCNIFYDTDGRLNLISGTIDISYSQEASIWEFYDILPEYMDSSLNYDFVNAVNVVKAIGNNVNNKIYEYTAENNNPLSPTRIELIGRKIKTMESPGIYNEDRAKDYAELMLNRYSIVQKSIGFSASMLPHLDVNKVIGITDQHYNYTQQRFIIQSIDIPFNGSSPMNISANNVAELPYYNM